MFHYAQADEHESSPAEVPTIHTKLSTKVLPTIHTKLSTKVLRTVFKPEFAEFRVILITVNMTYFYGEDFKPLFTKVKKLLTINTKLHDKQCSFLRNNLFLKRITKNDH